MKFFFCSCYGDSLSLALQCQAEGNDVQFLLLDPNKKSKGLPGRGLLRKLYSGPLTRATGDALSSYIRARTDFSTIIVFDMVSNDHAKTGPAADLLRQAGYAVIGASRFADSIELNREHGTKIMQAVGITTPKTASFASFDDGLRFIKDHPEFLVFKPNGNIGTAKTLVAETPEEMITDLIVQKEHWKGSVEFELQEKVSGIEVSVEGWFNGAEWIHQSFNSTIEEKKFLAGGLGPNTGCMGNVVWCWKHARPQIVKDTLLKLTSILKKANYIGPIDVNTKGGLGLEFTARFGYDAIQAFSHLYQGDISKLLADVARGQMRQMQVSYEFAAAVRLSIPPWPHEFKCEDTAGQLVHVAEDVMPWFHPADIEMTQHGFMMAGNDCTIGCVAAVEQNLNTLDRVVYERVKKVHAQDIQYRPDVLSYRAKQDIPKLLREMV